MKFDKLNLHPEILRAVKDLGYEDPTEIQAKCIPLINKGSDVVGQSKTGSGKTAAFGLPLLGNMEKKGFVQLLVVAPVRELAHQIIDEFRKYTKYKKLSMALVYGGVSIDKQAYELRKADIVVGTPGRILDHMQRGNLDLKNTKYVVLDEADRMFDMGFIDDITKILSQTQKDRQTMLFSATFPDEIKRLIRRYMRDPQTIKVKSLLSVENIKEVYYIAQDQRKKFSMFVHLLNTEKPERVLVFCATRRNADLIAKNLMKQKFNAQLIHGGLNQSKRNSIINLFKSGKLDILVATDVAARGLDINDVSHVFNYDIPQHLEDYIHRIGRTARAGKKGKAISIVSERDYDVFREIEYQFRDRLERKEVKDFKFVPFAVGEQRSRGFRHSGSHGGRSSYSRDRSNQGRRSNSSRPRRNYRR